MAFLFCDFLIINPIFINAQFQSIIIDTTITADYEFSPFGSVNLIQGLQFSGSVNLNSDSSLVRLIYIDDSYQEWLIMEAYSMITNSYTGSYSKHCDETCYFSNNIPESLRVEIVDASISADTLYYSTALKSQAEELQAQKQFDVTNEKVEAINNYLKDHHLRWTADYNEIGGGWYADKKLLLGDSYNYYGFEYYRSGIFETVYTDPDPVNTNMSPHFDWRNRHDANLIGIS